MNIYLYYSFIIMNYCFSDNDIVRLEYLSILADNSSILFIGRKKDNNTYKSILDDNNIIKKFGIKLLTIDISESNCPDIVCDFSSHEEREKLKEKLKLLNINIVMIIFDISVFKFMKDLKQLFSDIKQIIVDGGIFITEYNLKGGCM